MQAASLKHLSKKQEEEGKRRRWELGGSCQSKACVRLGGDSRWLPQGYSSLCTHPIPHSARSSHDLSSLSRRGKRA